MYDYSALQYCVFFVLITCSGAVSGRPSSVSIRSVEPLRTRTDPDGMKPNSWAHLLMRLLPSCTRYEPMVCPGQLHAFKSCEDHKQ
jgi:hypothetical protein